MKVWLSENAVWVAYLIGFATCALATILAGAW